MTLGPRFSDERVLSCVLKTLDLGSGSLVACDGLHFGWFAWLSVFLKKSCEYVVLKVMLVGHESLAAHLKMKTIAITVDTRRI